MVEWATFFEALTGEAGVIAILLFSVLLFLSGKILPKDYVNDLKETNKELTNLTQDQAKALTTLSESSKESLENTKTILKIIKDTRTRTGIRGDEYDHNLDSGGG